MFDVIIGLSGSRLLFSNTEVGLPLLLTLLHANRYANDATDITWRRCCTGLNKSLYVPMCDDLGGICDLIYI